MTIIPKINMPSAVRKTVFAATFLASAYLFTYGTIKERQKINLETVQQDSFTASNTSEDKHAANQVDIEKKPNTFKQKVLDFGEKNVGISSLIMMLSLIGFFNLKISDMAEDKSLPDDKNDNKINKLDTEI